MFKELDVIALTSAIPRDRIWDIPPGSPLAVVGEGLRKGDIGTIVGMEGEGEIFDVEFLEPGGRTIAIATVLASQARPATRDDIANHHIHQSQRQQLSQSRIG